MVVEVALGVAAVTALVVLGVALPIAQRMRGIPERPDGEHATDGLGCSSCGHTPHEAGLRPVSGWTPGDRRARCWAESHATGWGGGYCGCASSYHAS